MFGGQSQLQRGSALARERNANRRPCMHLVVLLPSWRSALSISPTINSSISDGGKGSRGWVKVAASRPFVAVLNCPFPVKVRFVGRLSISGGANVKGPRGRWHIRWAREPLLLLLAGRRAAW
ncbi:hypothetical protein BJY01DRAFT_40925 [Aspergillus pseudoustus]|uniref:Uncharacterized protein n=1 Tax=Aspergillus pseudoustus TaxID=1810923 RepID=A0ABR4JCC5_9EURO